METNEIETRKTIESISKTKSWIFKKISKTEKLLIRLRKKSEKIRIEVITTDITEIY